MVCARYKPPQGLKEGVFLSLQCTRYKLKNSYQYCATVFGIAGTYFNTGRIKNPVCVWPKAVLVKAGDVLLRRLRVEIVSLITCTAP